MRASAREALLLEEAEEPAPLLTASRLGEGVRAPTRRQLGALAVVLAIIVLGVTLSSVAMGRQRALLRGPFGSRTAANLVFEQDFRRLTALDPSVWNVARTLADDPNQGFQYYADDTSVLYVNATDGTLRITPGLFAGLGPLETVEGHPPYLAEDVMRGTCTPYPACATYKVPACTGAGAIGACEATGGAWSSLGPTVIKPTTSAHISTKGKFEFTYGRLELRVRLPAGDWLWPSVWLLSAADSYGLAWPLSGQMDVVESRGNGPAFTLNGQPAGHDVASSTFHYGENWCAPRRAARARARCARCTRPPLRAGLRAWRLHRAMRSSPRRSRGAFSGHAHARAHARASAGFGTRQAQ